MESAAGGVFHFWLRLDVFLAALHPLQSRGNEGAVQWGTPGRSLQICTILFSLLLDPLCSYLSFKEMLMLFALLLVNLQEFFLEAKT